jgi:hypothetical protein
MPSAPRNRNPCSSHSLPAPTSWYTAPAGGSDTNLYASCFRVSDSVERDALEPLLESSVSEWRRLGKRWAVTADRVTTVERAVAGVSYRLNLERAASTLVKAKRFAKASGVATVYGIGTARHDDHELLHRPELYLSHGGGRGGAAGLIELAAASEGPLESRRMKLRYDAAERSFHSGGRTRSVRKPRE